MKLPKIHWKLSLDCQGFLFWCLISLIFPLGSGILNAPSVLKCLLFLFTSVCLGESLLGNISFIRRIPPMLRTGFSMLMGTYLLFFIFALFPHPALLYILSGIFIVLLVFAGRFSWSFDLLSFAAALPVCILLIYVTDVRLATSPVFIDVSGDYFYYNALVLSLSKTLTIFDAIFHNGIPLNYQSLTFFSPAALTYATGIPAHIALHGIFTPALKLLSFSMLSASIVHLCKFIKGDENTTFSWKYYSAASVALFLIAPLHPLYLAKMEVKNFIFLGEGYLLPIGVMGFALAIILFGVLNFFFFSNEKKTYSEIGLAVIFFSSIAAIKTALFLPLLAFYGLYSFIVLLKDKKDRRIVYVILSLIGGAVIMKIFFGQADGLIKTSFTLHDGNFPAFFGRSVQKFHRSPTAFNLLLFSLFIFAVWLGLKILIFSGAFFSKMSFRSVALPIIIAVLGATAISFLPGCFLKILMLDENGQVLQDNTFDTGQFMRAGLFISTTIATAILLLLWGTQTGIKKRLFQSVVIIWFGLAFVSLFKILTGPFSIAETDKVWEKEVISDYNISHPRLMGMISNGKYSGQYLVAKDVYPWWTCSKRGVLGGYVCTLRSNYRNTLIEKLLNDSTSTGEKVNIVGKMRGEGVDALVATPDNRSKFDELLRDSLVTKPDNLTWIYKIR